MNHLAYIIIGPDPEERAERAKNLTFGCSGVRVNVEGITDITISDPCTNSYSPLFKDCQLNTEYLILENASVNQLSLLASLVGREIVINPMGKRPFVILPTLIITASCRVQDLPKDKSFHRRVTILDGWDDDDTEE
ncbi:hypothetical protein [Spirosoma endbachense]|uniref:Uncharacterized protein n=1 Tax=Spirosoma endbachense TaxID=2666025 RepID=A0A6P1VZB6_9BACT|nr:hypothetical protein [Spirosoma endbachense]QHV97974.1 hypothetical protein GJR95_24490 [Spirosoma endbachense]